MQTRTTDELPRNVIHMLKPGDWFAFDTWNYVDGEILYAEVIERLPRFPRGIDFVGESTGGYRVRVHGSDDREQEIPPEGFEDFYAWDFVDVTCFRLSRAQMERAREAGWPSPRAFLREELGIPIGRQCALRPF